jgi:hypothetical protein
MKAFAIVACVLKGLLERLAKSNPLSATRGYPATGNRECDQDENVHCGRTEDVLLHSGSHSSTA